VAAEVQPAYSQQSVSVRAALVKGSLPADDPTAAAWATAAVSEFALAGSYYRRHGQERQGSRTS